jgi:uncharacterized caspase-like protein
MALLIGNSGYPSTPLRNPRNDVQSMAAALRQLGFQVTVRNDLTRRQMDESTSQFASQLRSGDLALFYYSGHGVQLNQESYLIPVDFSGSSASDVRYNAMAAAQIRDRLEESGARLRILILDACRDNPYRATRGVGGGLAAMNSQVEGTLIAYSTADNSTAEDNPAESNGLYTKHLLAALQSPGVSLKQAFEQARDNVWIQSGRKQRPYVYDGIVGDLHFTPEIVNSGGSPPVAERPAAAAGNGFLLISADAPASVAIDGETPIRLSANEARRFPALPGSHLVFTTSLERSAVTQRKLVEVRGGEQQVVVLELASGVAEAASREASEKGRPPWRSWPAYGHKLSNMTAPSPMEITRPITVPCAPPSG